MEPKLLEHNSVGFAVGDPNWDIRNLIFRIEIIFRRRWNAGWNSIHELPGCSKHQKMPFAEHKIINIRARTQSKLPSRTDLESGLPNGRFLLRKVDPILLGNAPRSWKSPLFIWQVAISPKSVVSTGHQMVIGPQKKNKRIINENEDHEDKCTAHWCRHCGRSNL